MAKEQRRHGFPCGRRSFAFSKSTPNVQLESIPSKVGGIFRLNLSAAGRREANIAEYIRIQKVQGENSNEPCQIMKLPIGNPLKILLELGDV